MNSQDSPPTRSATLPPSGPVEVPAASAHPAVEGSPEFTLSSARILFEDPHLIIVNKAAPLLTQAPPGVPSLEGAIKAYIKEKYSKPAGVYLGIPHRLDRPVSGVVCFARNTKAAQRVHAQFADHRVRKVYWALVAGTVAPERGVWENWMRKRAEESRVEPAADGEPGAKLAMLEYRVLHHFESSTLLELAPLTGRMHQLRVQAAWRSHPVLGDAHYGSTLTFGPNPGAEPSRDRVIGLHARRLILSHPFTTQEVSVEAPLPDYWPMIPGISRSS